MVGRSAVLALLLLAVGAGPAVANPWRDGAPNRTGTPQLRPDEKRLLRLDVADARADLAAGTIAVPKPDGGFERFDVTPARVLDDPTAPVDTYQAVAVDDPATTAAIDLTSLGFHATVRGTDGSWSVDPYTRDSYAAYRSDALPRDFEEGDVEGEPGSVLPTLPRAGGAGVTLRTFRLALLSDSTFADDYSPTTDSAAVRDQKVLDAKKTLVNRVNQVYGQDLGVRLLLSEDAKLSMNTDADESAANLPLGQTASCTGSLIDRTTGVISGLITSGAYDVGHIVMGGNKGGLAQLRVVGGSSKGAGCTALLQPVGDAFAIDYLAHELGHQFGANHTFNGKTGNCSGDDTNGGNRHAATAVEPGSGSSVMAYAGICGNDNLQLNSDPYFSQRSITEVRAFLDRMIPGVGTTTATTDTSPVVTAPDDATIPPRTPFRLAATGMDPDGDPVTFSWEENDTGAAANLFSAAGTTGPLFRNFSAQGTLAAENLVTTDPTRTFPDVAQIAAGDTNAATGACAIANDVDCASEKLPTGPRTLRFRVTARDGLGGVSADDTVLTVADVPPLDVTSQPADEGATGGSVVPVTWSAVGLGSIRVDFLTSDGTTLPLAINLPDTGTTSVRLPPGRTGRIQVGSQAGTFFDLSVGVVTTDGTAEDVPPPPLDGTPASQPEPEATATTTAAPSPILPAAAARSAVPVPPLCTAKVLVTGATRKRGIVRVSGLASAASVTVRAGKRTVRVRPRDGVWVARLRTSSVRVPVRVAGAATVRLNRLISVRRKGSRLVGHAPGRARLVVRRQLGCAAATTLHRVRAGLRGSYSVRRGSTTTTALYVVRTADGRRTSLPLVVAR